MASKRWLETATTLIWPGGLGRYAVDRARSGANPVLLEFFTYRWKEHCGPFEDGHLGYRSEAEIVEWQAKCPVTNYRWRLEEEQALSSAMAEEMRSEIAEEISGAFTFAKDSPYPDVKRARPVCVPRTGGVT